MAATIHYLKSPHHPAVRSAYVRAMPRPAQAVYRRRRVGVLAIAVAIAAVGTFGLNGTKANANAALAGQQTEPNYVIAQSGDTLWAIANRIAPQANTAELVDELVRMNGDSISVGPQGFGQPSRPDMRQDLAWVEGRLGWDFTPQLNGTVAVGRREQNGAPDYTGWNAGVTYALTDALELDLRYYDTDAHTFGEQYEDALVAKVAYAF